VADYAVSLELKLRAEVKEALTISSAWPIPTDTRKERMLRDARVEAERHVARCQAHDADATWTDVARGAACSSAGARTAALMRFDRGRTSTIDTLIQGPADIIRLTRAMETDPRLAGRLAATALTDLGVQAGIAHQHSDGQAGLVTGQASVVAHSRNQLHGRLWAGQQRAPPPLATSVGQMLAPGASPYTPDPAHGHPQRVDDETLRDQFAGPIRISPSATTAPGPSAVPAEWLPTAAEAARGETARTTSIPCIDPVALIDEHNAVVQGGGLACPECVRGNCQTTTVARLASQMQLPFYQPVKGPPTGRPTPTPSRPDPRTFSLQNTLALFD